MRCQWKVWMRRLNDAVAFQKAGADMPDFAEALTDIAMYRKFTDVLDIPVLAKFGQN